MQKSLLFSAIAATMLHTAANAQYGSFDGSAIKAAKTTTTIVVLDATDTPYNRALMEAVKADWKFTGAYEFVKAPELAMRPVTPEQTFLMKLAKVDPVKFEGTFVTLVRGWKQKKGEFLQEKDGAFTNVPVDQELASILIDPKGINANGTGAMVGVYLKHLQDYLDLVATGKITDKTTADRTYSGRTRLVRDTELWVAQEHLDKTMPDAAKVKEFYTSPMQVMGRAQLMSAIGKQDAGITITDVVITGDYRNKHCFKRVFNSTTGELMYQQDDAAIFGKKEGFLDEDFKSLARAR